MRRLAYEYKTDWLLAIDADGSVYLRRNGGPVHYMGGVHNAEPPTVSGWRARVPVDRFAAMAVTFEEARAMRQCLAVLPEESTSTLTLGHAAIMVSYNQLEENAALARIVSELEGIAQALLAAPPTDRLTNPERDLWRRAFPPGATWGKAPDAPDVLPGALEAAQAAVDRFYAERVR